MFSSLGLFQGQCVYVLRLYSKITRELPKATATATAIAATMEEKKWRLHGGKYLGEISALCFLHLPCHFSSLPYLLAGTGSQILLYNLEMGKLVQSFQVFEGIRVHGIASHFLKCIESSTNVVFEVSVFGEKRVKLFNLHIEMVFSSQDQIENQSEVSADLALVHSLPRFSHWVLDVSFLKYNNAAASHKNGSHCLAIGCTDNSVCLWDISMSIIILEVQSPDRCLLYSMRLWGDSLEVLRVASGTIFNEIIVWKVVPQHDTSSLTNPLEDKYLSNSFSSSSWLDFEQHKAAHISRLTGHEGSIFRIEWSSDGSKLISVSDDRSARIWEIDEEKGSDNQEKAAGLVLFGHNARVWDCCISGSLIVTAGEDCTCRVWTLDGKQLRLIKEHVGRGIWRCLYDLNSSLLITAGFDSAIKIHQVSAFLPQSLEGQIEPKQFADRTETFTCRIPSLSENVGLMDSKSEYVRCLRFTREDTLYIATNHGYLYYAKFSESRDVKWTKLIQVSEEVPVVCMDLLSINPLTHSCGFDDWVALGDGKGNMTVVRVVGDGCAPEVGFTFTWSAAKERQLLGTYWCKALGYRFIFTADPKGILMLWRLCDPSLSVSSTSARMFDVSLIAEFTSCFGIRIICLDASFEDEVLACGDIRGNLVIFPLSRSLMLDMPTVPEIKVYPVSYFKGAHGISNVSSIIVGKLSASNIEIRTTGGDGCICYLEYNQDCQSLEFIGMKQVKQLSLIQSVSVDNNLPDDLANCNYAVGFASTDFIIWNLLTEAKVLQIPCGGWRRPHSYYLGDVPEMKNCFAYVKDEIICIHRQWVPRTEWKIFPLNLHTQFHGREIHSLCFISESALVEANDNHAVEDKSCWIATGCEDGTVRLTRYGPGVEGWLTSKLLGEHVAGSAVRSICCVSKIHMIASNVMDSSDWRNKKNASADDRDNPYLLISVGAKRVLTSWLMRDRKLDKQEKTPYNHEHIKTGDGYNIPYSEVFSSISFKWLSTDMPAKNSSSCERTKNIEKICSVTKNVPGMKGDINCTSSLLENGKKEPKVSIDKHENDWRYLAVTAFLVKCTGSRLTFCFVVIACSDATLSLRALVLPHRLWFDVALLVPLSSPVLSLQHLVIPPHLSSEDNNWIRNVYIVISGATDGSLAFWDITDSVEAFVQRFFVIDVVKSINFPTRPHTGRGSQGGRWWKSLSGRICKKKSSGDDSIVLKVGNGTGCNSVNHATDEASTTASKDMHNTIEPEVNDVDSLPEIREIQPSHVLSNFHQSGINCLHISDCQGSNNGFQFIVISGGDDQALQCVKFQISLLSTGRDSEILTPEVTNLCRNSESGNDMILCSGSQMNKYGIRFLYYHKIASAHCSAVKGVWTDGTWVFSTGLDQRIRCWLLDEHFKLTEQTHLIIGVPEPEALHARACGRSKYEIAVGGRGMQMLEFSIS